MKIFYQFPQGYRSEMQHARENNAFNDWVMQKYGSRVRELISGNFSMDIEQASFTIDFPNEDDGKAFLTYFGGRQL